MLCFPMAGVVPIFGGLLFALLDQPRGGIGGGRTRMDVASVVPLDGWWRWPWWYPEGWW